MQSKDQGGHPATLSFPSLDGLLGSKASGTGLPGNVYTTGQLWLMDNESILVLSHISVITYTWSRDPRLASMPFWTGWARHNDPWNCDSALAAFLPL